MKNQSDVIKDLIDKQITEKQAMLLLSKSRVTIYRMKMKYLAHGKDALIHGLTGRPSNHSKLEDYKNDAIAIVKKEYADFGPTLASEYLSSDHGLDINRETLRLEMIKQGIWKAKSRKKQIYRARREPRKSYGEMSQYDGSYEHWLETKEDICLLMAVDDATSKILHLMFCSDEGVNNTFNFWKKYLFKHGKPMSIYLDKFSTYKINTNELKDDPKALTQFERAMKQINVHLIHANSPQAKGRVERRFGNLQDRLIKALRLARIKTISKANTFANEVFVISFNNKFGKDAKLTKDSHSPLTKYEVDNLDLILARHEKRRLNNDFTLNYNGKIIQLLPMEGLAILKNERMLIITKTNSEVQIFRGKDNINFKYITKRGKKKEKNIIALVPEKKPIKIDTPWRRFKIN